MTSVNSNQYIYFSSENQLGPNPDSDFTINFSDPLVIPPYSQVRCVSIRINQDQNTYEVESSNDKICFSIGNSWISPQERIQNNTLIGNSFNFYTAHLQHGQYLLDPGVNHDIAGDEIIFLSNQVEKAMNEAMSNNASFRGGFSVTVNASQQLVIKLSTMAEIYDVPNAASNLIGGKSVPTYSLSGIEGGKFVQGPSGLSASNLAFPMRTGDATQYYGNSWKYSKSYNAAYPEQCNTFLSPSLNWMGVTDTANDHLCFKYYIALSQIDWTSGNGYGDLDDYIQISGCSDTTPGIINGAAETSSILYYKNTDVGGRGEMRENEFFKIVIYEDANNLFWIDIIYNNITGQTGGFSVKHHQLQSGNSQLIIECFTKAPLVTENAYKYKLVVWERPDGGPDYILLPNQMSYTNCPKMASIVPKFSQNTSEDTWGRNETFRLCISNSFHYTGNVAENFRSLGSQGLCFAYDPINQPNGFVNGAYVAANSLTRTETNIDTLPLVVYGSSVLTDDAKSYIEQKFPINNREYAWTALASAELEFAGANVSDSLFLGVDNTISIEGARSWSEGAWSNSQTIMKNGQNLPAQYLDVDLPLRNITGDHLYGKANSFICPIAYPDTNQIGHSRMDNRLYNTIDNSYPLRLSSLRIRICDLDGTVSKNMKAYTQGCLEIRENPALAHQQLIDSITQLGKNIEQSRLSAESQGLVVNDIIPNKFFQ